MATGFTVTDKILAKKNVTSEPARIERTAEKRLRLDRPSKSRTITLRCARNRAHRRVMVE